jgi:1,2-diacylglycerol 3-beta-glucosyltransferase
MILLSMALAGAALLLFLPTLSDLLSLARLALAGDEGRPRQGGLQAPRLLILVPAHDESLLIEGCVRSLLHMDYPRDRRQVVVIADNCTDDTADLARQAGAECLERSDLERRGKPWALAWALDQADLAAFDAVVIVDADSLVDPGFARAMAGHAPLAGRAVQGSHSVRNPTDSAMTRMAAVLSTVFYRYMYPLRARAGLSVPLTGNGMCIGTDILRERGWRAFSIAEDTELYVDLTRAGHRVEVEPDAVVRSQEARELKQGEVQRTRWRAGRLAILRRLGPEVFRARDLGFRQKLDMLGELLAPGPLVHLGVALLLCLPVILLRLPGAPLLLVLLLLPIVRLGIYTILAIRDQPDPSGTVRAFLFLPVYLVWRMGMEIVALRTDGDRSWIRTERHEEVTDAESGPTSP